MAANTARKVAAPPRKTRRARTVTVVVPEADDQVDEEANTTKGIPLFAGLDEEVRIEVYRQEPIEEGTIGVLEADADEATIRRRWGGGVYRLRAKGSDGKFGQKQRTVTIGGDPKFESKEAVRKFKIKMGEIPEDAVAVRPAAPAPAPALGELGGLVAAIIQANQAQMTAMMQSQVQAAEASRARDQQFFQTILTMKGERHAPAAPAADPAAMMPMMLKFLQLGRDMASGGGESDPITAFISSLPQILPQAQAMLATAANNQGAGSPPALAPVPPAAPPGQTAGPKITLRGPIAEQLMKTAAELQRRGFDPEKSLELALKHLADELPPAAAPANPEAPAPAPNSPPAAAAAAGNGTSPPARATRKK